MAIIRNFNGASLRKPGAYSSTTVNLTGGLPLSATGVVAIVGESEGGQPSSASGVLAFTSEDLASLIKMFKSGPIVDAARALVQPARDARVPNGASQILVYKTNASTAATANIKNAAPINLFTFTSANYGDSENLISVQVQAGAVDPNARIVTIKKQNTTEILSENANATQLSVQYTGANATATLTIQSGNLIVSAGVDTQTISLAGKTMQDLVDTLNGLGVFTATTTNTSASFTLASTLDPISTATAFKLAAVALKAQQQELLNIINSQSALVTAAAIANVEGTIAVTARTFLSGGALGASTNASFQAGFDALLAVRANIVVPLISQDASALITLGKTASTSTFTLDAVNLQAISHCITASNTKNRSERNCYLSCKAAFATAQAKARVINSERASMLFQNVDIRDTNGNIVTMDPFAAAAICAGIQAGMPVGTPTTFKGINVNAISHQDYNAGTQVDLAIDAGLTPLEARAEGGFRIVVGNTTYGNDASFVYNRVSVLAAADYVAFNLRQELEAIFTGNKIRTGTAETIKNTVVSIMSSFLTEEIIVGDDTNKNLGYKDLTVTITGSTAFINLTITPVQGIDFILARITLDNIQQTA